MFETIAECWAFRIFGNDFEELSIIPFGAVPKLPNRSIIEKKSINNAYTMMTSMSSDFGFFYVDYHFF